MEQRSHELENVRDRNGSRRRNKILNGNLRATVELEHPNSQALSGSKSEQYTSLPFLSSPNALAYGLPSFFLPTLSHAIQHNTEAVLNALKQ